MYKNKTQLRIYLLCSFHSLIANIVYFSEKYKYIPIHRDCIHKIACLLHIVLDVIS